MKELTEDQLVDVLNTAQLYPGLEGEICENTQAAELIQVLVKLGYKIVKTEKL